MMLFIFAKFVASFFLHASRVFKLPLSLFLSIKHYFHFPNQANKKKESRGMRWRYTLKLFFWIIFVCTLSSSKLTHHKLSSLLSFNFCVIFFNVFSIWIYRDSLHHYWTWTNCYLCSSALELLRNSFINAFVLFCSLSNFMFYAQQQLFFHVCRFFPHS
jgi:hypothetical protein